MTEEIELKFTIPADAAARLGRLPPVRAASHGRVVSRPVHSVYYDTPDLDLDRERVSLRLRRDGSTWLQTVKSTPRLEGGLHQREEIDVAVPAAMLDHAALVGSGVSPVFEDAHRLAGLRPVFETHFRRTTRALDLGDGRQAELAVDVGEIRAGEATAPISELEIELEQGEPADLVDFALALLEHVDLRVEPRSKAERGYALLKNAGPARPGRPSVVLFAPDVAVPDAFHRIVTTCVRDLLENGRGMLETQEAEYLHQARVAIRRLRLAFRTFADAIDTTRYAASIATLEWLAEDLGTARDWDVFTLEILPRLSTALEGHAGLERLVAWAETERDKADTLARAVVASKRHTRMVLELTRAMLREPKIAGTDSPATVAAFATRALRRRHRRVVKCGDECASLDAERLHQFRKDIKKLRYLAAFFAPLWPKRRVERYLARLARLQDLLGAVNDAVTVQRMLGRWRQEDLLPGDHETLGLVRGYLLADMRARLAHLPEAWAAFRDTRPFWRD
jgi:inorganic triphosphatase YgiF